MYDRVEFNTISSVDLWLLTECCRTKYLDKLCIIIYVVTARKRSLRRLCFYTCQQCMLGDTGNVRTVGTLLECILVLKLVYSYYRKCLAFSYQFYKHAICILLTIDGIFKKIIPHRKLLHYLYIHY